ncbi:MAG: hypothetical protein ACJ8HQ_08660 [Chthoniobacterales bacterium]
MHKDPPPGLFDARRPLAHVVTHGLVGGFILALFLHFGWSLWRQNANAGPVAPSDGDALVTGIGNKPTPPPRD